MRNIILIAAAALTGLIGIPIEARAQYYYGGGYYRPYYPVPYYPVPYGYIPTPYYAPPPAYDMPPPRLYRRPVASRVQHRLIPRRRRIVHRTLINPLLGPLPGAASPRRY